MATTAKGIQFGTSGEEYNFQASSVTSDLFNMIWPVGSYFTGETPPSIGTWTQLSEGMFLISSGSTYTAGATGGSATLDGIPAHTHTFSASSTSGSAGAHTHKLYLEFLKDTASGTAKNRVCPAPNQDDAEKTTAYTTESAGAHTHSVSVSGTTGSTGSSSVSNLPPYLAVPMWQRTA